MSDFLNDYGHDHPTRAIHKPYECERCQFPWENPKHRTGWLKEFRSINYRARRGIEAMEQRAIFAIHHRNCFLCYQAVPILGDPSKMETIRI